jgi:hypothetical protein
MTSRAVFVCWQQLEMFSERHAKECEDEIEEISLTTNNVAALPVATRSALMDFRSRAMTVGLFSDQDLYHRENVDVDDLAARRGGASASLVYDGSDGSDYDDEDDDDDDYGEELFSASGKHSPMPLHTRQRSSTTRKYSTATNLSDEDEEASPAASPSPLSAMLGLGTAFGLGKAGMNTPPRRRMKRVPSASRGVAMLEGDSPRSARMHTDGSARGLGDDDPTSPIHASLDAVVSSDEATSLSLPPDAALLAPQEDTQGRAGLAASADTSQFSPLHTSPLPAATPSAHHAQAHGESCHAPRAGLPPLHPPN